MNHESLREWLSANNLYFKDLAKEVGKKSVADLMREIADQMEEVR